MARTKITSPQLNPSKTTDANGWTKYDYGAFVEYKKRVTFSQTIQGGAVLSMSSSNLPNALSSISGYFLAYTVTAGGGAYGLSVVFEGSTSNTAINFTTCTNDNVSRAYTGFIDLTLTQQ